jgi:hypothetical protein
VDEVMERHLSTGVATIVALMAAHRAVSEQEGPSVAYCQEVVERIDAYLHADNYAAAGFGAEAGPIAATRSIRRL